MIVTRQACHNLEPFLATAVIWPQLRKNDTSIANDVDAMQYPERDGQRLLQQKGEDPASAMRAIADLLNDQRSQAVGRLITHDELGVAHKRSAGGQYLLVASWSEDGLLGDSCG